MRRSQAELGNECATGAARVCNWPHLMLPDYLCVIGNWHRGGRGCRGDVRDAAGFVTFFNAVTDETAVSGARRVRDCRSDDRRTLVAEIGVLLTHLSEHDRVPARIVSLLGRNVVGASPLAESKFGDEVDRLSLNGAHTAVPSDESSMLGGANGSVRGRCLIYRGEIRCGELFVGA